MLSSCGCGCDPYLMPGAKVPTLSSIRFTKGGGAPPFDKAGTHAPSKHLCGPCTGNHRDSGIEVEPTWWAALSPDQQRAVLAHEHGHAACGIPCEDCCDRHGGFLMRAWGYTLDGVRASFAGVAHERPGVPERALEGAQAHDRLASGGAHGYDDPYATAPYSSAWGMVEAGAGGVDMRRPVLAGRGKAQPAPQKAQPPAVGGAGGKSGGAPATNARPIFRAPTPGSAVPPAASLQASSGGGATSGGGIAPGGAASDRAGSTSSTITDPFSSSVVVDGNPSLVSQLQDTLTGTKVDPVIVRSELLSGLLVAFLVFVVFRWGGT